MDSNTAQKPIFTASENDVGQRVDNYLLKQCKKLNKASCYKLIRKGQIRINGKRIKPSQKLAVNDLIRVPPFVFFVDQEAVVVPKSVQQQLLASVIFEDTDYLVLNKPAGLPCHTGTGHQFGVIEIINSIEDYGDTQLAHRLDKDTSGCLLLAKNRAALLVFQQALQAQQVNKVYLAVLVGHLHKAVAVSQPLDTEHRVNGIRHVIVSQQGQSAHTEFQPISTAAHLTLARCEISSGRTHQIRAHAKYLKHPVLGDRFYGHKQPKLPRSLYLHAQQLRFGDRSFTAPMPIEFEQVMVDI